MKSLTDYGVQEISITFENGDKMTYNKPANLTALHKYAGEVVGYESKTYRPIRAEGGPYECELYFLFNEVTTRTSEKANRAV